MRKRLSPLIYSIRTLSREPLLSLTLVALLGFGIAANTTIFTVMDQVLFTPLPYRDSGRILMLWETNPKFPEPAGSHIPAARDNFDAWRRETRNFEAIEAYQQASNNLTGLGNAEHLNVARCTAGFFSMLGVRPKEGRAFLPEDEDEGRSQVVLVSDLFFRTHFQGSDPIGRVLLLNGDPYTIIGVLPKKFHLPNIFQGLSEYKPDVWVPLPPISTSDPPLASKRRNLLVYARLKNNASMDAALAELKSEGRRRAEDDPALNSGYSVTAYSLSYENTDPILRKALYILGLAVALVLFLISINVSGLMFLRSTARQKDTAILAALGARRQDLIMTATAPALVLTALGALLGVAGAYAGIRLVVWLKPSDINAVERIAINANSIIATVLVFAILLALIAFLPARSTGRIDLGLVLQERTSTRHGRRPGSLQWSFLASAEIAIALVLTIASLLLVRSVHRLLAVDPGFQSDHILTAHVSLPQPRYSNPDDQFRFCNRVLDGLHSIPQVRQAGLIDNMPLYAIHYAPFEIEGHPALQPGDTPTADYANLTPEFFETMSIRPFAGRLFTEADVQDNAAKVVIVNKTLAHALWAHEDPLGKRIRSGTSGHREWATVVGVVADFVQFSMNTPPRPELFWPARRMSDMTIVLKTTVPPLTLGAALKQAVWQADAAQPITDVQTMDDILRHSTSQARFNMDFLTVFAGLGIFIALVGVYGLMSYLVTSRMREIGIRLALGAHPKHVAFSLLRQMAPCVAIGIMVGVGISLLLGKLMRNLLFGIAPSDALTYIAAPVAIFLFMSMAGSFPLKKATQADPARILRQE
jgi:putative ABC transport system permease protein